MSQSFYLGICLEVLTFRHGNSASSEPVVDLHWSLDGLTLAVASPSKVLLFCAQRLDDLTGQPPWAAYASIPIE